MTCGMDIFGSPSELSCVSLFNQLRRTSSSSRAITTRMGPATQGTKTAVTPRDPRWRKWESSLLPLPQVDWSWPQTIRYSGCLAVTCMSVLPVGLWALGNAPWVRQDPPACANTLTGRAIGVEGARWYSRGGLARHGVIGPKLCRWLALWPWTRL